MSTAMIVFRLDHSDHFPVVAATPFCLTLTNPGAFVMSQMTSGMIRPCRWRRPIRRPRT